MSNSNEQLFLFFEVEMFHLTFQMNNEEEVFSFFFQMDSNIE